MPEHVLLLLPAMRRVYGSAVDAVTEAEVGVLAETVLTGRIGGVGPVVLGGRPYLRFELDSLDEVARAYLANLSCAYALFARDGDLLRPIVAPSLDRYPDDLLTIQRYQGKTNESFTKLLLNVTMAAAPRAAEYPFQRVAVLDPLAGRGTTLNQAVMYGFDAAGVESDPKAVDAYLHFFTTWLEHRRAKHSVTKATVERPGRLPNGRRTEITFAPTKGEQRAGVSQTVRMICDDTAAVGDHLRNRSFDVVVTDLPYGIQHAARSDRRSSRNPLELVDRALPAWIRMLKHGGGVGLSWNTRLVPRAELARVVANHGLQVRDEEPFRRFEHRVDQAITRDLLVAVRD